MGTLITAGITGHQDLGSRSTQHWVKVTLRERVKLHHVQRGLTSLAVGADQLFALVLLEEGIPFEAIIPCQDYDKAFEKHQLKEYQRLLRKAVGKSTLSNIQPSEKAFWDAGRVVADQSDILFAVWDGLEAKGLGGTGDVVEYAKQAGKYIVHIDPINKQIQTIHKSNTP